MGPPHLTSRSRMRSLTLAWGRSTVPSSLICCEKQKLQIALVQEKPDPRSAPSCAAGGRRTSVRDEGLIVPGSLNHVWIMPVPPQSVTQPLRGGSVKRNQSCQGTSITGQTKQRHPLLSCATEAGCPFTKQTEGSVVYTENTFNGLLKTGHLPKTAQGSFPICHIYIMPKNPRTTHETYISACA